MLAEEIMHFCFPGAVGLLLRFISPITVVCTIVVLGIGFFDSIRGMVASHWPVSLL